MKKIQNPVHWLNLDKKVSLLVTLGILKPGERVSAIATHPKYGTSEPMVNAVVRSLSTINQNKIYLQKNETFYFFQQLRHLKEGNCITQILDCCISLECLTVLRC